MPELGDKVLYVPHECHALERDAQGNPVWVIGRKVTRSSPGGGYTTDVEELRGKDLNDFVKSIRMHPNPQRGRSEMVLMHPRTTWIGIVRGVHEPEPGGEYGSLDLDISSGNGITLHYDGVPFDSTKQRPHSYHFQEG